MTLHDIVVKTRERLRPYLIIETFPTDTKSRVHSAVEGIIQDALRELACEVGWFAAERGTTPPEGLDARIREVARNAVEIAIIRNDLEWDEDADMTAEQIAANAADALFGEGTCDDKPVLSVSRLRDAAAQRAPVTSQISEFFVSGELLDGKESLWLALSTLQQLVTKWEGVAADYRKRQMFDFAQEAGSFADELKEQITHIKADYASNAPYKGTKAQRAPVEQGRERLDEARWWHARIGLNHGMKWCCERIEELERVAEPKKLSAEPDHAREGALPTVDEIAEAMADARLWAGAWEQMCEAERNVMRQGAEGVYKLLEARR